jgi:hypothetical protein
MRIENPRRSLGRTYFELSCRPVVIAFLASVRAQSGNGARGPNPLSYSFTSRATFLFEAVVVHQDEPIARFGPP